MGAEYSVQCLVQSTGRKVVRRVQAESSDEARGLVRAEGLIPVNVKHVSDFFVTRAHHTRLPYGVLRAMHIALAVQLDCGENSIAAVTSLARGLTDKRGRKVMGGVRAHLLSDSKEIRDRTLAGALAAYPRIWNNAMCAMVRAAEAGGKLSSSGRDDGRDDGRGKGATRSALGDMFSQVNLYCDEMHMLHNMLMEELTMPAISLGMGMISLGIMTFFTMPRMAGFFHDMGLKQLPVITEVMIGSGQWLQKNTTAITTAAAVGVGFAIIAYFLGWLMPVVWMVAMRTPILRSMLLKQAHARFCVVFRAIERATNRTDDALRFAASAISIPRLRKETIAVAEQLKTDVSRSDFVTELRNVRWFDHTLLNTMEPDKAKPRLGVICEHFATAYTEEAKYLGKRFSKVVGLVALAITAIVAVVALSAYMFPMLDMLNAAGK